MLYLMFIKIISGIMAMKKYDTTYIKTLTNKEIQYNGCIPMLCLKGSRRCQHCCARSFQRVIIRDNMP